MNQQLLNKLDNYLDEVIDNQEIPGSIISIGIGENNIFQKFYGYQQLIPNKIKMKMIYRNYIVEHLGFTGTGIWIDPIEGMYVILLTNRVHPTRENTNIQNIRKNVKEIVFGKSP